MKRGLRLILMTLKKETVRDGSGAIIGYTWQVPSGGFRGKRIGGYTQPWKQLDRAAAARWVHLSHFEATKAARDGVVGHVDTDETERTSVLPVETMRQLVWGAENETDNEERSAA